MRRLRRRVSLSRTDSLRSRVPQNIPPPLLSLSLSCRLNLTRHSSSLSLFYFTRLFLIAIYAVIKIMTIPSSALAMEDGGPSCLPLPPEEEKRIFTELIRESESNLEDGNLYYVISNRWFTRWTKYVGLYSKEYSIDEQSSDTQALDIIPSKLADSPGPIDNSDIILDGKSFRSNDLELRKMLEEGQDYVLVPQSVWQKLLDWYTGGPALQRKLIAQGVHKNFDVEVYPLCLNLIDSRDDSESIIRISKKATVGELLENVCALKGIECEKMSLWDYFNKQKQSVLECSSQSLEESNLQMDQDGSCLGKLLTTRTIAVTNVESECLDSWTWFLKLLKEDL